MTTFKRIPVRVMKEGCFVNSLLPHVVTIPDTIRRIESRAIDGCANLQAVVIDGSDVQVQRDSFVSYDDNDQIMVYTNSLSVMDTLKNSQNIYLKTSTINRNSTAVMPIDTEIVPIETIIKNRLLKGSASIPTIPTLPSLPDIPNIPKIITDISNQAFGDQAKEIVDALPVLQLVQDGYRVLGPAYEGIKKIYDTGREIFNKGVGIITEALDYGMTLYSAFQTKDPKHILSTVGNVAVSVVSKFVPIVGTIFGGLKTVVNLFHKWFPPDILSPEVRYEFHLPGSLSEFDFSTLPPLRSKILDDYGSEYPQIVTIVLPMFESNYPSDCIKNFTVNTTIFYRLVLPPEILNIIFGMDPIVEHPQRVQMIVSVVSPLGPSSQFFLDLYDDLTKLGAIEMRPDADPLNPDNRRWAIKKWAGTGTSGGNYTKCPSESIFTTHHWPTLNHQVSYYSRYSDTQCFSKKGIEKNMAHFNQYYSGYPDLLPETIINDYESYMRSRFKTLSRSYIKGGKYEDKLFSEMKFVAHNTNDQDDFVKRSFLCFIASGRRNEIKGSLDYNDQVEGDVTEPKTNGYQDDPKMTDIVWNWDIFNNGIINNVLCSFDGYMTKETPFGPMQTYDGEEYKFSTIIQLMPIGMTRTFDEYFLENSSDYIGSEFLENYRGKNKFETTRSWGTWPTSIRPDGTSQFDMAEHIINTIRNPYTNYWVKNSNPFYPVGQRNGNVVVFAEQPITFPATRSFGMKYRTIFTTMEVELDHRTNTRTNLDGEEESFIETVNKSMQFLYYDISSNEIRKQKINLYCSGDLESAVSLINLSLIYKNLNDFVVTKTQKAEFINLPTFVYLRRLNIVKKTPGIENPDTTAKVVAMNWEPLRFILHGEHFYTPPDLQYLYFAPIVSQISTFGNHYDVVAYRFQPQYMPPGYEHYDLNDPSPAKWFDPWLQDFEGYTKFKFREGFQGVIGYTNDTFYPPFCFENVGIKRYDENGNVTIDTSKMHIEPKELQQTQFAIQYRNQFTSMNPYDLEIFYKDHIPYHNFTSATFVPMGPTPGFMKDLLWNIIFISNEPESERKFMDNNIEIMNNCVHFLKQYGKYGYMALLNYYDEVDRLYHFPEKTLLAIHNPDILIYRLSPSSEDWFLEGFSVTIDGNETSLRSKPYSMDITVNFLYLSEELRYQHESESQNRILYGTMIIPKENIHTEIYSIEVITFQWKVFEEPFVIDDPSVILEQACFSECTFKKGIVFRRFSRIHSKAFDACTIESIVFMEDTQKMNIDDTIFWYCTLKGEPMIPEYPDLATIFDVEVNEDPDNSNLNRIFQTSKFNAYMRFNYKNTTTGKTKTVDKP